ncbi:hypothetical protein CYY_000885 [Polysphondylium violaceum]|uniref:CAP-Gly domain-containing protein n=1 Tax=Polysphondylium violaceum TaxID=133409 RepID=A0A8J4Q222_9MYCE|nr:hypothetical protein CYY_000885 [Polysphondylium violaceum]
MAEEGKSIPVGSRASITGKPELGLGMVKYVGMTKFAAGRWVGIELDKPAGKNDGTVQGERYFDCKPSHGIFVKTNMVTLESGDGGEADDMLMPPPATPAPSGIKQPASSSIRPPSSTGIRPPSSLGKGRPSLAPTTSTPTPTSTSNTSPPTTATGSSSGIRKPTESGIKRPSLTPSQAAALTSATSTTTTTSTSPPVEEKKSTSSPPIAEKEETVSPKVSSPKQASPPTEPIEETSTSTATKIPRPSIGGISKPSTTSIPKPSVSKLKESSSSISPPTTTVPTTTTTTTTTTPTPVVPEIPKPTPTPTPQPTTTTTTTTTEPVTPIKISSSTNLIEPSIPAASPMSERKKPKIMLGEDDDEEEEEINDLLNKSISNPMSVQMNETIEKMMKTINELTEYKNNSTEEINTLQDKIKEITSAKDKASKDYEKQIQQLEKSISSKEKENDQLLKQQQKYDESIEKQLTKDKGDFEKERQSLLDQINQLNENLELLTLDKELVEEKLELKEMEYEELKEEMEMIKIEFETMKLESLEEKPRVIDESLPTDVIVLQEQNEKLKEAVVKLRDMTINDKHDITKKTKDIESLTKQFNSINEKSSKLEQELSEKLEEIVELKQALEDAEVSESLITDLTDKNLELSEELGELKGTLADLEDFRDLYAELTENQTALEKSLRQDINAKEIENLNLSGQLANSQLKLQEAEKTMAQFRDLVGRLQHKLEEMRKRDEENSEKSSSWTAIQQQLLSQNIQLQNQVIRATAMEIDHQLEKQRAKEAELHLGYVYEYLPEQGFHADNDAIKMLLLLQRILLKSELAQKYLNRVYKVEEIGTTKMLGGEQEETLTASQVGHSLQVTHILDHLNISATWLSSTLERCSSEHWLRAGRSAKDMRNQEKILDHLLSIIKNEQFGSAYATTDLEKITNKLDTILANVFGSDESLICKPEWSILLNYILNIQYYIKQIMLADLNISSMTNTTDTIFPQKEMSKVLSVCRKVVKNLVNKPHIRTATIIRDLLNKSENTCKSILSDLVSALPKMQQDPQSQRQQLVITVTAKSDLLVGQLDVAGVGIEDEYSVDGSGDDHNKTSLEKLFHQMHTQLSDVVETILAGDLDLSEQDKEALSKIQSPWIERATILKQSLNEVGQLRDTIASKEAELLENLKSIKAKEAELIEEKRKEESFDKRIKILQKAENELTEKIERDTKEREENEKKYRQAIKLYQKERGTFEQEIKSLQQKNQALLSEAQKKAAAPAPTISQDQLFLQADNIQTISLKKTIKFLRTENIKLKSEKAVKELYQIIPQSTLISLKSKSSGVTKDSSNSSPTDDNNDENDNSNNNNNINNVMGVEQSKKQQIKFNEIMDLSKQVSHMMSNVLESLATPKILDISSSNNKKSNSGASSSSNPLSFGLNEIEKQKLVTKQYERKAKQLQSKLTSFISSSNGSFGLGNYADANLSRLLQKPSILGGANNSGGNSAHFEFSKNSSLLGDKDIQLALSSQRTTV